MSDSQTIPQELKLTLDGPGETKTILFGKAPEPMPINPPIALYFSGHIEAPRMYIEKMDTVLNHKKAIVTVQRENLKITLDIDPTDKLAGSISGSLTINPDLAKFKINGKDTFKLPELIKFLKMRKRFFEKPEQFTKLLDSLTKFKGKVTTDYEREKDNKGNFKAAINKEVSNELPENFVLEMPIFERERDIAFKVDIVVDVRDAEIDFWFESAELEELFQTERDSIMQKEVDLISANNYIILEK